MRRYDLRALLADRRTVLDKRQLSLWRDVEHVHVPDPDYDALTGAKEET